MSEDPRIAASIEKYSPEVASDLRAARAHVASRVPRGFELVYETYNTLAFGFSPSERASGAVVSVAAYPKWVTLFFLHGASLRDPSGILQGAGKRVRSVRLQPLSKLLSPEVSELLTQALSVNAAEFSAAPALSTIVKSIAVKQRPRRSQTNADGPGHLRKKPSKGQHD